MLILLDIDGVMVSGASWKRPTILSDGFFAFEPRAVMSLQKIISETGATILLTTSHKINYTLSQWSDIFKARGIAVSKLDFLKTDTLQIGRKEELLEWYSAQNKKENFVIIDDDKTLNALPSELKERLVLTSSLVGLTNELALDAISILERNGQLSRA